MQAHPEAEGNGFLLTGIECSSCEGVKMWLTYLESERMDDPRAPDRCAAKTGNPWLQGTELRCGFHVVHKERETYLLRRIVTTFSILGRRTGSSCQQRSVVFQTWSVKSGSCGRSGRSPSMISETATGSDNSGNGYFPVKTLSRV